MNRSIIATIISSILLTLASGSLMFSLKQDGVPSFHPLSDEMINYINELKPHWKAGRNFNPNTSMAFIRHLAGTFEEPWYLRLPLRTPHNLEGLHIPSEFDARTKWPNCPSIKEIRDQGSCASCWAFAATETMTDRYCIVNKGQKQFRFSAENLLGCCQFIFCGMGCYGGVLSSAWRHFQIHGIVSGGPYGSNQGCQPYEFPPCEHQETGSRSKCTALAIVPPCEKECQPSYSIQYKDDLHYGNHTYSVQRNVQQIQVEIMKNGPVSATFSIYTDFLTYKSGVYHHVSGSFVTGHAIKIIGWGEENGLPYWTVANSWNTDFGENGFFRIRRGVNECKIEASVQAGIPKIG